jgi:hypothetical protein
VNLLQGNTCIAILFIALYQFTILFNLDPQIPSPIIGLPFRNSDDPFPNNWGTSTAAQSFAAAPIHGIWWQCEHGGRGEAWAPRL